MSQWQPMDTAPKDGTKVDLWVTAGEDSWRMIDAEYRQYQSDRSPEGWYDDEGDSLYQFGVKPLFWLPAPPTPGPRS